MIDQGNPKFETTAYLLIPPAAWEKVVCRLKYFSYFKGNLLLSNSTLHPFQHQNPKVERSEVQSYQLWLVPNFQGLTCGAQQTTPDPDNIVYIPQIVPT